jgi:hypothetical protein
MIYEIPEYKLAAMLERAAEIGAKKVLAEQGLVKTRISQNDAFRRFGRKLITRWREQGKLAPVKIGHKIHYDLNKLEILIKTNDLYGRDDDESGNPDMDVQPAFVAANGNIAKTGKIDERIRGAALTAK